MTARPLLHLIDGSGYIFRAYYGIRPLHSRDGLPTHAVVGVARMLIRLLREEAPTYLAVAFDTAEPNFRHRIYPDYKANREAPPEDLVPQIPLVHELIRALNVPLLREVGFEADDLIATLTQQAVAAGFDVVVVSADKDLMQLVGDHVQMFDPMKGQRFDRAGVVARFGVPPEHIVDLLGLAGDSSDNIPGVPRVGPKTAAKLIQTFGDLEAVIAGLTERAKLKAAEAGVLEHAEQARLSRRLAELCMRAPVHFDPDTLRARPHDGEAMATLMGRLDAHALLREFAAAAPPTAAVPAEPTPAAAAGTIDRGSYRTLRALAELEALLAAATRAGRLSVDLETTSLAAARADIVGIALCVPGEAAAYVPVAHTGEGSEGQLPRAQVLTALAPILADARVGKVGQNLKYDWVVLARAGLALNGIVDDAMVAAWVLDPDRPSYGMDSLSRAELDHSPIAFKEVTGGGKGDGIFAQVPVDRATAYAAEDADVAARLCAKLVPKLKAAGAEPLYRQVEMPLVPVLARMEHAGVQLDTGLLAALSAEYGDRMRQLEDEAYAMIGRPVNLASPKQLAHLLFEELGLPPVRKTKTGYSTDQEVLETLARSHALPRLLLDHRLLAKLKNTYLDALPRMVNADTGRVHTSFNQTGTATGRLSSHDPNLQNIPIRGDDGRRIRAAFIAAPGSVLVTADYSQIELRVMAHLAGDAKFIAAFKAGEDVHRRTAMEILTGGAPPSSEMRRRAKAINFGILYGLSEFGLSRQLNIPRHEARAYIAQYFARYPDVLHHLEATIERGRQDGFVTTLAGRRRYLPNLRSANGMLRAGAERIAKNTPLQGSAADLIKMAMLRVQARLEGEGLKARLVLQVHDELVMEAPEAEAERVGKLLREEMTCGVHLAVPLEVDVGMGASWAEAH